MPETAATWSLASTLARLEVEQAVAPEPLAAEPVIEEPVLEPPTATAFTEAPPSKSSPGRRGRGAPGRRRRGSPAPVVDEPVAVAPVIEHPVAPTPDPVPSLTRVAPAPPTPAAAPPAPATTAPTTAPVAGKRRAPVAADTPTVLPPVVDTGRGKHAAPAAAAAPAASTSMFTLPVMPVVSTPVEPEPPAEEQWAEADPEPSLPVAAEAPESTTAAEPAEIAQDQDGNTDPGGPSLRLIVASVMAVVLLGAGVTMYLFAFADQEWALKPMAMLSALGAFLVTNTIATRTLI